VVAGVATMRISNAFLLRELRMLVEIEYATVGRATSRVL